MEIRVLRYFLMAAREGNLTRAANRLHVSQPTLSRQLAQLEDELGIQLFVRTSHAMKLTSQGQLLMRKAQEIVDLHDQTLESLTGPKEVQGILRVGSGEFASFNVLVDWLCEFGRKYPLVTFDFFSGSSDYIMEKLEAGLLDIGLLMDPVHTVGYTSKEMPDQEIWIALVDPDNPLSARTAITPADLHGLTICGPARNNIQATIQEWMGDYSCKIQATGNLPGNVACYARARHLPYITLRLDYIPTGMKSIPLDPPVCSSTTLVWKSASVHSPIMEAFLQFLQDQTPFTPDPNA